MTSDIMGTTVPTLREAVRSDGKPFANYETYRVAVWINSELKDIGLIQRVGGKGNTKGNPLAHHWYGWRRTDEAPVRFTTKGAAVAAILQHYEAHK